MPCHSTPLVELGSALDAVFQPEETKKVKPIRKVQECAAGMSKDQGAKPKLPLKPQDTLLPRTSNPRNLTFNLRNVKSGKKSTCAERLQQPPLSDHLKQRQAVENRDQQKATSNSKDKILVEKKINPKSKPSLNCWASQAQSPGYQLSKASRPPGRAPNTSVSSMSSLNSTRSISLKQPKKTLPTHLNAMKVVNSRLRKPKSEPAGDMKSKAKPGFGSSVQNESNDHLRKKIPEPKVSEVGKRVRLSSLATAKLNSNTCGSLRGATGTTAKTDRASQSIKKRQLGLPNDLQFPRKTNCKSVRTPIFSRPKSAHIDHASREAKNSEDEELKNLKRSFLAMTIVAKWEGERGEHFSLLKGTETKEKLKLEKRLEELRDLEKVSEDMKGVVAQLEAAIQSQGIDHESEIASIKRRFDEERANEGKKRVTWEAEVQRRHQNDLESFSTEHFAEVARLETELCELSEKMREEIKEKEELEKSVSKLEAKVASLVVSLMQGGEERREGVVASLKQEVQSLSMVLEMRSRELREEQEKRVTLEMEIEEHSATARTEQSLRNQIEGLRTQLEAKRSLERERELEVLRLQDSLKKENKENRRLSMERERLEWKVMEATPPAARSLQMKERR